MKSTDLLTFCPGCGAAWALVGPPVWQCVRCTYQWRDTVAPTVGDALDQGAGEAGSEMRAWLDDGKPASVNTLIRALLDEDHQHLAARIIRALETR